MGRTFAAFCAEKAMTGEAWGGESVGGGGEVAGRAAATVYPVARSCWMTAGSTEVGLAASFMVRWTSVAARFRTGSSGRGFHHTPSFRDTWEIGGEGGCGGRRIQHHHVSVAGMRRERARESERERESERARERVRERARESKGMGRGGRRKAEGGRGS